MNDTKQLREDIKEAQDSINNALDKLSAKYKENFEFDVSIMKVDSIGLDNVHITTIEAKLT